MDARAKIEKLFGVKIEAQPTIETRGDQMRQAQAVLEYWESPGEWAKKICRQCELEFAYKWNSTAISYCSVRCMSHALEKIGLKWDPTKPPEERWGRIIPAVVPPQALDILQELASILEDLPEDIIVE